MVDDGASLEERDDEGDDAVEATSSHGGKGRFSVGVAASNAASDAAHSIFESPFVREGGRAH